MGRAFHARQTASEVCLKRAYCGVSDTQNEIYFRSRVENSHCVLSQGTVLTFDPAPVPIHSPGLKLANARLCLVLRRQQRDNLAGLPACARLFRNAQLPGATQRHERIVPIAYADAPGAGSRLQLTDGATVTATHGPHNALLRAETEHRTPRQSPLCLFGLPGLPRCLVANKGADQYAQHVHPRCMCFSAYPVNALQDFRVHLTRPVCLLPTALSGATKGVDVLTLG